MVIALKMISILCLNESLLCEATIGSKKYIIGTVYRPCSQNSDESESFLPNNDYYFRLFPIVTLI